MYFLGTIQGGSGSYSNQSTGVSGLAANIFTIPKTTKRLYLVPSVSGINFELGTASGFQTSATRCAPIIAGQLNGPYAVGPSDEAPVCAIYNAVGGIVTCRIYTSPR